MSKYTTELRFICETYAGKTESSGYNSIAEIIEKARPKVFDFSFPMFDESYRPVLETKILKRYYTREISEETVGLWKLRLDTKLNEIMPYFNKLYKSELIQFNPLYMTDLHTVRDIDRKNQASVNTVSGSSSSVNNVSDDWTVYSETPQGSLTAVEDETYLTNATHSYGNTEGSESSSESTSNTASNATDTEDYVDHVYGWAGSNPSENIVKFREALLNIDVQILDELKPLFFNLW